MNFGSMDDNSPYQGYWSSQSQAQRPIASSPPTGAAGASTAIATAIANEHDTDDASFAESYGADTSPLFNPMFQPRSTAAAAAASLRFNPVPGSSWSWQRESESLGPGMQSSPLAHDNTSQSRGQNLSHQEAAFQEPASNLDTTAAPADSWELNQDEPRSPTGDIIAQQLNSDRRYSSTHSEILGEDTGNAQNNEEPLEVLDRQASEPKDAHEGRVAPEITSERHHNNDAPDNKQPQTESIKVTERIETAVRINESADVEAQPISSSAPNHQPLPEPENLIVETEHTEIEIEEALPETEEARIVETEHTEIEIEEELPQTDKALPEEAERPSPEGLGTIEESAASHPSEKKRRRSDNDLLEDVADAITHMNDEELRSRHASAPAVKQSKASSSTAAKHGRKSMPAKLASVTVEETPKKRGRPRKSEGPATPATAPVSTGKRGRPRKADATPVSSKRLGRPPSSVKPAAAKPSPAKPASQKKMGRPRKVQGDEAQPAKDVDDTPKRRGRPPKNTAEPSSAKPASAKKLGRPAKVVKEAAPKKRGRPAQARVVLSPVKSGRPVRMPAAVGPKAAALKAPKGISRSRPRITSSSHGEEFDLAKAREPPKRRGRPPKNPAVAKEDKPAPAPKPATKRQTRTETVEEPEPVATRKRGRAAQTTAETPKVETAPASRKRGRPAASEPEAKKQRTTRQTVVPAKPSEKTTATRGRGRRAAEPEPVPEVEKAAPASRGRPKKTPTTEVKNTVTEEAEPPKPKGRGRGRQPAAKAPSPVPSPVEAKPTSTRRGRSGKGELPTSKPAADAEPKRSGRAAKAAAAKGPVAKAAAPKGVVKKTAKKSEPVPRRVLRSVG
ncbi:hypothetical protein G7046_g5559 [Stylonectria norvegica]|nr:hypothetical protein G7046_g5559 [Stylonectria norvegica]